MEKKKIIIGFSLLAAFILMLVLSLWALQKEPSDKLKSEQAKQVAIKNAESSTIDENNSTNYTIEFDPESGFQVVYEEDEDKFTIFIMKSASQGLTSEEFADLRNKIENYFVKDILKIEEKKVACNLNVVITTLGAGDHYLPPSPLSYCD